MQTVITDGVIYQCIVIRTVFDYINKKGIKNQSYIRYTMESLNIVDLLEKNPITKLSNTYQNKLLTKLKERFNEIEQKMFLTSFFCYLKYKSTDFVIDLDSIYKWVGFQHKAKAKVLLEKHFKLDIDYKMVLNQQGKQGGHNKETFLLTVRTFKSFCLKASTSKARQIHEYYMNLEETLHEVIEEESDELKRQLESKDVQLESMKANSEIEKELLREKTIIQQFPDNRQCIYYGLIDNKSEGNEKLIKFGSSNFLCQRVTQHKNTYTNFRLVNAFEVGNKTHVENEMKRHPLLSLLRRPLKLNDKCHTELLSFDSVSLNELDKIIKSVIADVEYNPDNYNRLLDENHRLKKDLLILQKKIDDKSIDCSDLKVSLSNYSLVGLPLKLRRYQKAKDGKYYIDEICYDKLFGSRDEVWKDVAYKTTGELIKSELTIGNGGKIVSKKKRDTGKLDNRLQKNRPRMDEE
jgi:phage anti-repressor protein